MAIEEDPPAGIPEWVMTFGDMMSLLLTFFILLFSLSGPKAVENQQALVDSLRKTFGRQRAMVRVHSPSVNPRGSPSARSGTDQRERRAGAGPSGNQVQSPTGDHARVEKIQPGTFSTVGGVVPFDEPSSDLSAEGRRQLEAMVETLAGKSLRIAVQGHTTRRPLPGGSPYGDDWGLAFARCRAAAEHLVSLGIERERIQLNIFGHSEPLYTDPALARQNSRVEVYLLNRFVEPAGSEPR